MTKKQLPQLMWWLGYGGLIPFFTLTILLLWPQQLPGLEWIAWDWVLAIYAAAVLTFIGAMHWAVTLSMQQQLNEQEFGHLLLFSMIPTAIAWFAILLPFAITFFVQGVLVALSYLADKILLFPRLAPGYQQMRLHLTVVVSMLLCASGIVSL